MRLVQDEDELERERENARDETRGTSARDQISEATGDTHSLERHTGDTREFHTHTHETQTTAERTEGEFHRIDLRFVTRRRNSLVSSTPSRTAESPNDEAKGHVALQNPLHRPKPESRVNQSQTPTEVYIAKSRKKDAGELQPRREPLLVALALAAEPISVCDVDEHAEIKR